MRLLHVASAPPEGFVNAKGSTVHPQFAMEARKNPDVIHEMAENTKEFSALVSEALVRNYVLIIDRSRSMGSKDGFMSTRWKSARKATKKIIREVFDHDMDGKVPIFLFDHEVQFVGECTTPSEVDRIFEDYKPRGSTKLAECLDAAMKAYSSSGHQSRSDTPGTTYIVLLDGRTDNDQAVKDVLRHYANPANGHVTNHTQIAVSFVQIGKDRGATRYLQDLDDGITDLPDIVDTKKVSFIYKRGGVKKLFYDAIFD